MNPYNIDQSELLGPIMSLTILYESMPETVGCEKCKEVNGDDEIWCCKTQSPSMYYIEFLKVWREAEKWSKAKRSELTLRAIRNHLDGSQNKGCIFYDGECTVYEYRPFSCRMYGIIPEESWQRRWDALKERDGDKFDARPQCSLVSVKDENKTVTDKQEQEWFDHSIKCEKRVVSEGVVDLHDAGGGSYRTFHDHLLIELFDEHFLTLISKVRLSGPSIEDIDNIINDVRKLLG